MKVEKEYKKCIEDNCNEPVKFVRHTQFAGSHPFCEVHAKQENDFMEDDSYTCWSEIQ